MYTEAVNLDVIYARYHIKFFGFGIFDSFAIENPSHIFCRSMKGFDLVRIGVVLTSQFLSEKLSDRT